MRITKQVFITLLASVWVCQAYAGYQITVKTVSDADSHGTKKTADNVVKMTSESSKARIDFTEGQVPGAEKGSYLLTQDSGKTFIMVMPDNKAYMKWDMDSMMNMAGAMGNMLQMKITDPKVETILDESGPAILGYPTRHYKLRTSYRVSMNVMGFKNESTISKDDESWATTKLDLSALGAWAGKTPKTNNQSMDQLIQSEKNKMKGFPLKTLSITTTTNIDGKISVSKSSMEVTEIKTVGADTVSFEIPSDYQEMSLPMTTENEVEQPKGKSKSNKSSPSKIDFGALMKQAMEQAQ
jgi:hypothetical protein